MEKPVNNKHKIDSLISDNTPSTQPARNSQNISKKCNECNRKRKIFDKSHEICHVCYNIKTILKPKQSGNKVIDDFIKYTQSNYAIIEGGKMEYIPYDQFINIKFIAEGGFSKIYKATWVDGPINNWNMIKDDHWNITREKYCTVVLKKLNNSKNITSKELNELKVFYQIYSNRNASGSYISRYFGITQDPITKDIIIIMPYYKLGDLIHYISDDFFNISWETKLYHLDDIICGLKNIHKSKIIHRDLHSGNIFFNFNSAYVGDLGISKSATECTDNCNENYGIIPYMAPEIFQGQKYTEASDIYSYGMIMWEFMTGRRPFWNENHDIELIIKICDGLRPPTVTNVPEGYVELMKECWHSDPNERPTAAYLEDKIWKMHSKEKGTPIKIIKSSDIGPVTMNNLGAVYKSRPLSHMIQSAMSLRRSRSQSIDPFYYFQKNSKASADKRKVDKASVEDSNINDQSIKRRKLFENENYDINASLDYFTKEIELDINANMNQQQHNEYVTKEFDIDINNIDESHL
ncbi:kinase-like domain-containing protein [Rhizophagus diaphanus]|nr:kinase-like domain-containing protein [Rhizophagus diaphanus] [Rhizophagus sp. MUCL 43196]